MNKDISKAIMDCLRLRRRFLRSRSIEDRKAYNKQRTYCVSLIRKIKKDYYSNLDYKKIIDNKSFWKYVKPLFTDKNASSNKINLVEDNSILENNDKIAETFNNFFTSAVSNLNIPPFVDPSVEIDHIEDPILRIIEQYKNHPNVVAINEKNLNKQFSFEYIPKSDIKKEILNLDVSKASQDSDIPTKIIKVNADIFAEVSYNVFNRSLEVGEFPSGMKLANVTPVHKKGSRYDKGNNGPDSILPNLSKVFERCLHKHISNFFIPFCPNINAVSGKDIVRSTA